MKEPILSINFKLGFHSFFLQSRVNPLEKNMHPLPYIPKTVIDPETNEEITLINVAKSGKRSLSKDGQAILMGLSQKRGA